MESDINPGQNQEVQLQIAEGAEAVSEFGKHWDDLFARAADVSNSTSGLRSLPFWR